MRLQEARGYVLQVLKQPHWNQVVNITAAVGILKAKTEGKDYIRAIDGRQFLQRGDEALIMEVLWSLIIQGLLVPGTDDSNPNLPFLRLTDYGRKCIQEERILPHDPDGYLAEFRAQVPGADATIEEYLAEALQCYLHGLNRAAAVMLGGASEKAVLVMIETCGSSIADPIKRKKFEVELQQAQSVFRKYELFEKKLAGTKAALPKLLTENMDSLLRGVFDLIRASRNDAGHPASGGLIDRDLVYSHLRLFIPYCRRVNDLTQWFARNKT